MMSQKQIDLKNGASERLFNEKMKLLCPNGYPTYFRIVWDLAFMEGIKFGIESKWKLCNSSKKKKVRL